VSGGIAPCIIKSTAVCDFNSLQCLERDRRKGNCKDVPLRSLISHHEEVLGKWRYSSTHS
jgi:hypothetical protein